MANKHMFGIAIMFAILIWLIHSRRRRIQMALLRARDRLYQRGNPETSGCSRQSSRQAARDRSLKHLQGGTLGNFQCDPYQPFKNSLSPKPERRNYTYGLDHLIAPLPPPESIEPLSIWVKPCKCMYQRSRQYIITYPPPHVSTPAVSQVSLLGNLQQFCKAFYHAKQWEAKVDLCLCKVMRCCLDWISCCKVMRCCFND